MTWEPEFKRGCLNPDYAPPDMGDAFQRFAGEALHRRDPHVHTFPVLGRDGAIDLVSEARDRIQVYEAKQTEKSDFFAAARASLLKVARTLRKNLTPVEPKASEYKPWYNQERPINHYHLCFSCRLSNLRQIQDLHKIISDCLKCLANLPHLSHLGGVHVEIMDWGDFLKILEENPNLVLRWFEPPLPLALEPFDKASKRAKGFHAYLRGKKLRYFLPSEYHSLCQHDAPPDPKELLRQLLEMEESGLVIIGPGGIGKSRLCEEVAKAAQEEGQAVLRVTGHLKAEELDKKRAFFTSERGRYLLLFDYLEDQRETLSDLLRLIDDWRTSSCDVRFLANCRFSFDRELTSMSLGRSLKTVRLDSYGMSRKAGYTDWVVRRILERLDDVKDQELAQAMANGLPVFAVFVVYVRETFGGDDLKSLLHETEFAQWMIKRMLRDASDEETERELALLAALFPISDESYGGLYSHFQSLLDHLASDGWIVKSCDPHHPQWEFVHDVLADELLIAHLRRVGPNGKFFVAEVFDLAEQHNSLDSVLRSFDRNADEQIIAELPWRDFLPDHPLLHKNEAFGKPFLCRLLNTRLLPMGEREALLNLPAGLWARAHLDHDFQDAFGRLLTEREQEGSGIEAIESTLLDITRCCLRQDRPSMLLIPPALRFMPEDTWETAVRIVRDPNLSLQRKNSIMVALLEAGVPFEKIGREIHQWLENNKEELFAARVLTQCCKSGEEPARIVARKFLPGWLDSHGTKFAANFVLRAALIPPETRARRTPEPLVPDSYVARWLQVFKEDPRARFVIESWLKSKGPDGLYCQDIVTHVLHWLNLFATQHVGCRVLGPWLWQFRKDGIDKVRDLVHLWLKDFHTTIEAQYVLTGWLKTYKEPEDRNMAWSVQRYVKAWLEFHVETDAASFVLPAWLDSTGSEGYTLAEPFVRAWLRRFGSKDKDAVCFVLAAALEAGGELARFQVSSWLSPWLHQNAMSEDAGYLYRGALRGGLRLEFEGQVREWLDKFATDMYPRTKKENKIQKLVEDIGQLLA